MVPGADEPTPTTLEPFESAAATSPPASRSTSSIKPTESRKYTIETKGASDTLLALFEHVDGEPRFLAGDDDSGEDRNASHHLQALQGPQLHRAPAALLPGAVGHDVADVLVAAFIAESGLELPEPADTGPDE